MGKKEVKMFFDKKERFFLNTFFKRKKKKKKAMFDFKSCVLDIHFQVSGCEALDDLEARIAKALNISSNQIKLKSMRIVDAVDEIDEPREYESSKENFEQKLKQIQTEKEITEKMEIKHNTKRKKRNTKSHSLPSNLFVETLEENGKKKKSEEINLNHKRRTKSIGSFPPFLHQSINFISKLKKVKRREVRKTTSLLNETISFFYR